MLYIIRQHIIIFEIVKLIQLKWWLQMIVLEIPIDAVNQGNWSLSVKLRLECFVIAE